MEGFKKHIKKSNFNGKDKLVSLIGYIALSRVPGMFVRFQYSYVFSDDLKRTEDYFMRMAFKEALMIHFLLEATSLDVKLTIDQIEDNSLIFSNKQLADMVEFIHDK